MVNVELSGDDIEKIVTALMREREICEAGPDDDYKETITEYNDLIMRLKKGIRGKKAALVIEENIRKRLRAYCDRNGRLDYTVGIWQLLETADKYSIHR